MKPTSFVPMVGEISAGDVREVPGLQAVVSYWTEEGYSAEEWFRELNDLWGTAGFAVRRGGEVQGFVVYGPPVRRAPYRMSYYTLAHIDLKSAVEVGELARALVGRVKLPELKSPVPGALARSTGEQRSR